MRRSKARKCGVRGSGILWIGFDEDVEIFSGARLGVEGNGVASDDEYLTPWAWKDRNSSLKSGNIRQSYFHGVNGAREFGNRLHPLMDRATPPVAILVRFHLGVVVVDVDRLIHDSFVAPGEAMFNGRNQVAGYRLQVAATAYRGISFL